ncbi:MAG: TetR/AcrR family transcriptional regulator [Burkholderiales bacterium]
MNAIPQPRPSGSTRQCLLDQGLLLARSSGLRSITVRGLCQRAGANPGSFVYHFGNRDRFIAELIESWYAPLFAQLQWQHDRKAAPLDRLQAMLRQLLGFINANGAFIAHLAQDAVAGEAAVQQFVAGLGPRHPRLLLQAIREAQQAGQLRQAPPKHVMLFLISALGLPMVVQHMASGKDVLPGEFKRALALFAADPQHVEQRLQWALRGLSPGEMQA